MKNKIIYVIVILLAIVQQSCYEKKPVWMQSEVSIDNFVPDTLFFNSLEFQGVNLNFVNLEKGVKNLGDPFKIIKNGVNSEIEEIDSLGESYLKKVSFDIYDFQYLRFTEYQGKFEILDIDFSESKTSLKCDGIHVLQNGSPISLIKETFPKSYAWRNYFPNEAKMLFSNTDEVKENRWTNIMMVDKYGARVNLYYIDRELKYLIRSL